MRGTVAKRIRKEVYGDYSHIEREYKAKWYKKILRMGKSVHDGKQVETVTIRDTGLRRKYQDAKKTYLQAGR